MSDGIIIVGGGQAAIAAASRLRELDQTVPVTLLSDEPVHPYQRPPLSKTYLSGDMPLDRLLLRSPEWFEDNNVTIRLKTRVEKIHRPDKFVVLQGGEKLHYNKLLLATGARVRRLPDEAGGNLDGVHYLRKTGDSDLLSPEIETGKRLLVIGGGYIGLEVAAVAAQSGMDVTVVEMAERILQRVAAPETSDYYRLLHRSHGVRLVEGSGLKRLLAENGRVSGAQLSDGSVLPADCVIVGIGVTPCQDLAETAGLETDNGVVVNSCCQTSDPDIFAAGDCTLFPFNGSQIRLESVPNAIHQAEIAAANMTGQALAYVATPWFWSDQYGVKLQIAGLNAGYDSTVVRPGKREGAQSVWYYQGDRLLAVDAMNDAPSFMLARKLLEAGKGIPPDIVADPAQNLKQCLKQWM